MKIYLVVEVDCYDYNLADCHYFTDLEDAKMYALRKYTDFYDLIRCTQKHTGVEKIINKDVDNTKGEYWIDVPDSNIRKDWFIHEMEIEQSDINKLKE